MHVFYVFIFSKREYTDLETEKENQALGGRKITMNSKLMSSKSEAQLGAILLNVSYIDR